MVFVGSYYQSKAKLFKKLCSFDFAIWGPGWNKVSSNNYRAQIKGEHTLPSEWIKIYSASKIVLAPHYQSRNKKIPVYQASPRIFEAMDCGAFVISDCQKDVFTLFNDKEHLVGFKNEDELIDKIHYYLENGDEKKEIAMRGRQEVLAKHKYVDRIRELISIIETN